MEVEELSIGERADLQEVSVAGTSRVVGVVKLQYSVCQVWGLNQG